MEANPITTVEPTTVELRKTSEEIAREGMLIDPETGISKASKEFFDKHPKCEDALELTFDERKAFVKTYYAPDTPFEEKLDKMLTDSENTLDTELDKPNENMQYSEEFYMALINLSKGKILDDLLEIVKDSYEKRRDAVMGFDMNDQKVLQMTELSCNQMTMKLQQNLLTQIENECKSRELDLNHVMPMACQIVMCDMSQFIDIERFYVLKTVSDNKDKEISLDDVRNYICYSLALSTKLLNGKIRPDMMLLLPHILSDNLFNKTGFEGEEIVYKVQEFVADGQIDENLINLIIREAYSVEQGKEKSFKAFEQQMAMVQMAMAQQQMMAMGGQMPPGMMPNDMMMPPIGQNPQGLQNPMDDPAVKKLMEMGMAPPPELMQMMGGPPPPGMMMPPADMMGGMGGPPGPMGPPPPEFMQMMQGGVPPELVGLKEDDPKVQAFMKDQSEKIMKAQDEALEKMAEEMKAMQLS